MAAGPGRDAGAGDFERSKPLRNGGFVGMKFSWSEYETSDNNSCTAIVKGLKGVVVAGRRQSHSQDDIALSFHGISSYSTEIGDPLGFNIYSYRSERCDEILHSS